MSKREERYEAQLREDLGGLKSPYARLAGDLVRHGLVDYFQSTHTRRYREGRDFLLDGWLLQFLMESLGGNYQVLVSQTVKEREEFIHMRQRDERAARKWWKKRFPWCRMPESPIKRYRNAEETDEEQDPLEMLLGGANAGSN